MEKNEWIFFVNEKNCYFLLLTVGWKRAKISLLLVILSETNADGLKVLVSLDLARQSG